MGVYLDFVEGENAVTLDTYVGKREHLHSTAFGKAILAHLPQSCVDSIVEQRGLDSQTDATVDNREELADRLEVIRERGFAVDKEERLDRLRCVAAPILQNDGTVLGAVSIAGPTQRFNDSDRFDELTQEVMRTSNIIEINITYS